MIGVAGDEWGKPAEIAERTGLKLRTIQRYVAGGTVRRRFGLISLADVVDTEKTKREAVRVGRPRKPKEDA